MVNVAGGDHVAITVLVRSRWRGARVACRSTTVKLAMELLGSFPVLVAAFASPSVAGRFLQHLCEACACMVLPPELALP